MSLNKFQTKKVIRRLTLACAMLVLATGWAPAQDAALANELHLGADAMRDGQPNAAAEHFLAATKIAPRLAEAWMNLALARDQQGKLDEEIAALETALKLKPGLRGANLFLGIAHYKRDDYKSAAAALNRELSLAPKDAKAMMWLGITELSAGNPEEAGRVLDKAAQAAPKDVDILYHRGRAHWLVSQKSYEQMFAVDPHSWRVHEVLAQAYAQSDRQAQAISEYEAAIKQMPFEPGLHAELANQYWDAGQPEKAEATYLEELRIDPRSVLALYKLGSLRVERANAKDGVPLLQQALATEPQLADASYYLGKGMAQLGQYDEALARLNRAIASQPSEDTLQRAYYQLALVYRKLHRPEDSKAALANFERLKQEADTQSKQKFQERLKEHDKPAAENFGSAETPADSGSPK